MRLNFTFSPACATSEFADFFFFFTLLCGRGKSNNLDFGITGCRPNMCEKGKDGEGGMAM